MQTSNPTLTARGPEAEYFSFLDQGRFLIQHCSACTKHVFFPRTLCPYCGAGCLTWVEPTGSGKVYSVSVIAGKPGTGTAYNVALIDLEESVRLMSRVEGVPADEVYIGMQVQVQVQVKDGKGVVVFVPKELP